MNNFTLVAFQNNSDTETFFALPLEILKSLEDN